MHYFKDKQGNLTPIEDKYWKQVLINEPWIQECDSRGAEIGKPLTILKGETPLQDKIKPPVAPIIIPMPGVTIPKDIPPQPSKDIEPEIIEKVTKEVKTGDFNKLEKLKEEKLEPFKKLEKKPIEKIVMPIEKKTVKPKSHAKSTGAKRKRTAKKA